MLCANASTNATTNPALMRLPLPASTSGLMLLPLKVPTPALVQLPLPASTTNATTTESTNASAKEDANKDGNAEDIDSIQSPTLTKSRISGKGVKWFC
ncbi:hypothetical protein FOB22_001454 [Saccharomyces cerevisiae]|nr:hypothetical protein FOB22_001454 [Saccharomyces cerevisiae]